MNGFRRFQRFVPILTLIAALAALGMEIQQRLSNRRAPSGGAPGSHSTGMPGAIPPGQPEMVFGTVNGKKPLMDGWNAGKKQYGFTVNKLSVFPGGKVMGEGINGATLLDANGKPSVQFSAERAVMDQATSNLEIQGEVHVNSLDPKNPVAFVTRDMQWNAAQKKLICPNPVQVTKPGMVLQGSRMTADVQLKKIALEGGIYFEAEIDEVNKTLGLSQAAGKGTKRR